MRRAKIVCTLGPASSDPEILKQMIQAGLDVARLNFSHGTHDDHRRMYEMVRSLSDEVGKPVAILQDLQGPKIRVGKFENGSIELKTGDRLIITTEPVEGNQERVSTTYPNLPNDVNIGSVLLLDDGLLRLSVVQVTGHEVHTVVEVGGILKNNKGINLPGVNVSAPSLTDRDKDDLELGLELGVDYVALSFVRAALDMHMLRARIGDRYKAPKLIAKIEKPEAVQELDAIIAVSDGIMIARGDLGEELPPEKVPMFQKHAILQATRQGCLTITATQMLDSMTNNPRPTRAEASDVANAILDGSGAVMLSGETASGRYPVETIRMMDRIIREVEQSPAYTNFKAPTPQTGAMRGGFTDAVARAATVAADDLGVKALVAFTESGRTARLLTSYRPSKKIIACTPNSDVLHKLQLYWGVVPATIERKNTIDDMVLAVERLLQDKGLAIAGDEVIIIMGTPFGVGAETNLIKFHRVGGLKRPTGSHRRRN